MMRGGNMQGMMKQMKKLQKEMAQAQEELNAQEFKGAASDDAVVVTFNGEKKMQDIQIKAEAIDPEDPDMLQDLIIMAVNNALTQVDQETEQKMGKYTRGLPGM
ncbi:YbaB/EbfC family nucleoid-associated protein [Loigolactobacillus coryniformis]|jgi:DNA-binding YbaB/EbfC family protein|uniref:Nucleoid-associated protein FGL77_13410 n=2 Tax=Loigolactobacillus coryniformis TaxID=1610 RepID=A0A5B8TK05_9LACO|nr:YbaB/EbfC family nucleoid-associated protein [Loigolactobacillus coryniformis]RRG06724.1 MAG: YbaB/EbfC family nucleoid-associated protein [Lactobacillus sp.]